MHGLDSNIILNLWESNGGPTISDVIDPRLLAARTVSLKYKEDNPSYDTTTRGPFQAEYLAGNESRIQNPYKGFWLLEFSSTNTMNECW